MALWQTAVVIKADTAGAVHFRQADVATLTAEMLAGRLPAAAQAAMDDFLRRYGMRGIAEIDIGRPRWRKAPTPLIQVLQSYLQIEGADRAPDVVFERGAASAQTTIAALAGLRESPNSPSSVCWESCAKDYWQAARNWSQQ